VKDCGRAGKAASQRRWLHKPKNRDYFKGPANVQRVQTWRAAHPGYSRRIAQQDRSALQGRSLTQAHDNQNKSGALLNDALKEAMPNSA